VGSQTFTVQCYKYIMRAKNVTELLDMKSSHEIRVQFGVLMYIYSKYILKIIYIRQNMWA